MGKFNINKIIEHYMLDIDELAKVLFPYIKYPKQAFDRVLRGEANLDTSQVENLASYIGVLVYDLYTVDGWRGVREDSCLTFIKDDYKAKLNYNGVYLSIYKGPELVHQELELKNMSMVEFTNHINTIINNINKVINN